MSKKQLGLLFICSFVPWTVGNGLLPLLPVYATQFGADSAIAGYYLAVSYIAITLGALSAGWISDGLDRRKLPLIIAGLINIPATWLMGQVHTIWGLTALTVLLWYFGGMMLALISILAGLSAGESERGRIFGILALTMGLGGLVGGLGVGWLVERWGYGSMFAILSIFTAALPLIALLLEEKNVKQTHKASIAERRSAGLGKSFYILFAASILASIAGFFVTLIRSIVMSNLKFNPLEIASTGAVAGLINMPFPLLMGWLSDRIGRKTFLFIAYLSGFSSLVILAFSRVLWHFWVVFVLAGISMGGYGVSNALVTDLVPREYLGKGLAVYSSAPWIAGVIGFAAAGYLLENMGLVLTLTIGGCVALVAVGLIIPIQTRTI